MKLRNKYTGLYTFDTDNHKYVTLAQADGIIDLLDTDDYAPTEPLIKDKKIRKAVLAWCEANDIRKNEKVRVSNEEGVVVFICCDNAYLNLVVIGECIEIKTKNYTITELCGEEEECEN